MIYTFQSQQEANLLVANKLALDIINTQSPYHCILTGGRSPKLIYNYLVNKLQFTNHTHFHVWISDERMVDIDSSLSNTQLLTQSLVTPLKIAQTNLHFSNSINFLNKELQRQSIHSFDFSLLGMGEDGHIASLFPDRPFNESYQYLSITQPTHIAPQVDRVSMSLPMLNSAKKGIVLVYGESKIKLFFQYHKVKNLKYPFTYLDDQKYDFVLSYNK